MADTGGWLLELDLTNILFIFNYIYMVRQNMIQMHSYFMNQLWYISIRSVEWLEFHLPPQPNFFVRYQEEDYGNHSLGSLP